MDRFQNAVYGFFCDETDNMVIEYKINMGSCTLLSINIIINSSDPLGMPSKKKLLRRRNWSIQGGVELKKSPFFSLTKWGQIFKEGEVKIFLSHVHVHF